MAERLKLTRAQREALGGLAHADGAPADESIVKALGRRGLAERRSEAMGHMNGRHVWRITPAGRAALNEARDAE